jgi:hypothetical protein
LEVIERLSRSEAESQLSDLRGEAIAEIKALDLKRERLVGLVDFIDDYASSTSTQSKRRPKREASQASTSVVDLVGKRPGIRTSMVAMVVGRPVDDVASELRKWESEEVVARKGLGWRVTDLASDRDELQ